MITTLKGHSDAVTSVAFSPDGKRLGTGSRNQMLKLWAVDTGQELLTLKVRAGEVWSVVFSPDGQTLAAGGSDETVKLWRAATRREVLSQ